MRRLQILVPVLVVIAVVFSGRSVAGQDLAIGSPVAGPSFEDEFTDVSDYWTVAWDDSWSVTTYSAVDYGELLQLSDGTWTVRLEGPIFDPVSDAQVTPGDARTALVDLATAIGVEYPMYTADGRPLQHFSPGRAWRVYVGTNGEPLFLDVRTLDDAGAFLYITAWVEGGITVFNENYQHMLLLLENVRLLR